MPKSKNRKNIKYSPDKVDRELEKNYQTRVETLKNATVIGVASPYKQEGKQVRREDLYPNTSYKNKYSRLNQAG